MSVDTILTLKLRLPTTSVILKLDNYIVVE